MTDRKEGLQAALKGLVETTPPIEEAAQLDLLPVPAEYREIDVEPERRGPGRPKGSANVSTEAWRRFLLSRYRSPLEGLGQLANLDVLQIVELSKEMKCKPIEVLRLVIVAMKELAPYLHQKMPLAVEGNLGPLMQLIIATGDGKGSAIPDGETIEGEELAALINQELSPKQSAESDIDKSDEG